MDIPAVRINARGKSRVTQGQAWVFRQEIIDGPKTDARAGGPALVEVRDERGRPLAVAMWASDSPIALRVLEQRTKTSALPTLTQWLAPRLDAAIRRRDKLPLDRDAYRVVHAESDGIPGWVVDRYADAVVMQTNSVAMHAHRADVAALLEDRLRPRMVIVRDDGSARDFEGLPRESFIARGQGSPTTVYRLGPNTLETDLLTDSKTGGFLDQADNHAVAARLAPSGARCLDAFTAHGGFALALARKGGPVLATDENDRAVAHADANAKRNGLGNMTVRKANAFDLLRELEGKREQFDVVVLDPPALAKRKGGDAGALRAYHELFLRGLRLTVPDGLAVFCSCSGRITREMFDDVVAQAARDSGRPAQILQRLGAGMDHPERADLPETGHLKCWFLRVP